jgi:excisionase family DNA binding protein
MGEAARHSQARAFTVASLARQWECSEGVIRKLIGKGQLRAFRIGVLIRIPADEVERFECQNIPSNDSAVDMQPSGEAPTESDTGNGFMQPIGLGRKQRLGGDGAPGVIHRGPWGES